MTVNVKETKAGVVVSIVLELMSMGILAACLSRRLQVVRSWRRLPLVCWLVLLMYCDSMIFVMGTSILSLGFGVDSSQRICSNAILLCLCCYLTTKFIYYFLVEKVYIVNRQSKPRLKSKLYLFNTFGLLIPYLVVIVLNFYYRFAIIEDGVCRIGMKKISMIPLISFDIMINIYLTSLFLKPLMNLHSYETDRRSRVRTVAKRTFIGSCCTLISTVVNLTVLMALDTGEPGWICLICCNVDTLFSVLVIHFITTSDNAATADSTTGGMAYASRGERDNVQSRHRRTVSGIPLYEEIGLSEYQRRGGVVTLVTATKDMDEEDLQRMHNIAPGVITVEREHAIEIEEGRSNIGTDESSPNLDGRFENTISEKSTEDLFKRN